MSLENINAEDFQRYANAKKISIKCQICSDSDISIHSEREGKSYVLLEMDRDSRRIPGAGIAWVILVLCRHCGNLRTFNRLNVEEWLKANE